MAVSDHMRMRGNLVNKVPTAKSAWVANKSKSAYGNHTLTPRLEETHAVGEANKKKKASSVLRKPLVKP